MRSLFTLALLVTVALSSAPAALADDASRISGYVLPYYNSNGPVIKIGPFSSGLAARSERTFVSTVLQMKKQWNRLSFPELYVAAIRLYDLGYRNEATYWFYSAQYKGRQFAMLVDQRRLGNIGDPGFELYHAQDAFFEVAGPVINGYAFGDIDELRRIIQKVASENRTVADLTSIYPGISFKSRSQWQEINASLNDGLSKLSAQLTTQKDRFAQQRAQNGTAQRFANVSSKPFPGGY